MAATRNFSKLSQNRYDLLIIGGGITGACIARDAAQRGLTVALVEAKDFCHATSAATTKLVHGGLRYLENFEFGLVRESLRERRAWQTIAPHMVKPLPFIVPTYGHGRRGRLRLDIGLTLYDILSFDRNRLDDPNQHLPGHRDLSTEDVLKLAPGLKRERLTGGMIYYDCQMYAPERIGLECLLDAHARGAHVANYAKVIKIHRHGKQVTGARVKDELTGDQIDVTATVTVNAAGPWADELAAQAEGGPSCVRLIRSKGIHLITWPIMHRHALTIFAEHSHVFILPWRGHSIIGTTDTIFDGDPNQVHATEEDIHALLTLVNETYPGARLRRSHVLHTYAGLRPLVDNSGGGPHSTDSYRASRKSEICDHQRQSGLENFVSAVGGKWTTSRRTAEKVVDLILRKLKRNQVPCRTHETPLPGGETGRFSIYLDEAIRLHAHLPAAIVTHLARTYGSRLDRVIDQSAQDVEMVSPHLLDLTAQVSYAVREEMAVTLEDVIYRRTGLGTLCHPGVAALDKAARLMAPELGWDDGEIARQIKNVQSRLTVAHAVEPQQSLARDTITS